MSGHERTTNSTMGGGNLAPGVLTRPKSEYVTLDDELTIHYQQAGDGDLAILFIPGLFTAIDVFARQLAHFAGSTKFRAIAFDPRGQGHSSKPMEGHTYQQHARDLAALIAKLGLNNVILAGWSFGVTEQLAYLSQYGTEKLRGMIMIDNSPVNAGKSYDEWVGYLRDDSDEASRWFTEGVIESREAMITGFCRWMLEHPTPEAVEWLANIAYMTPATVASCLNANAFYMDFREDLIKLDGDLPLLYIVREERQNVAEKWIKANTPNASAAFLGKHMMFWDRAEEFNSILDRFLLQF